MKVERVLSGKRKEVSGMGRGEERVIESEYACMYENDTMKPIALYN
jgi:hypothetical protein